MTPTELERGLFGFIRNIAAGQVGPRTALVPSDAAMEKLVTRPDPRLTAALNRIVAAGAAELWTEMDRGGQPALSADIFGFALAVCNGLALAGLPEDAPDARTAAFTDALLARLDPPANAASTLARHAILAPALPGLDSLADDLRDVFFDLSPLTALWTLDRHAPSAVHDLGRELLAGRPVFPTPRHPKWPDPDAWIEAVSAILAHPAAARSLRHRWLEMDETRTSCRNLGLALEALRRRGGHREILFAFYEAYDRFAAVPAPDGGRSWPVFAVMEKLLKTPGDSEAAIRANRWGNQYFLKFRPLVQLIIEEDGPPADFRHLTRELIMDHIRPLADYITETATVIQSFRREEEERVERGEAGSEEKEERPDRFKNSLGMEFVWIEPGTFMMGRPGCEPKEKGLEIDEAERPSMGTQHNQSNRREPVDFDIDAIEKALLRGIDMDVDYEDEVYHEVALTKGYYLQTTQVTQGQWESVMGSNPSRFQVLGLECPVENVSWNDAMVFIQKLNELGEGDYRLPMESEWEYACRAGSNTSYCFNADVEELDQYAWHPKNSGSMTHPVGRLKPNAWGLHDMHGNVWEWCQDRYGQYPGGFVMDPTGPDTGVDRVIRGGSWGAHAMSCRSACRDGYSPVASDHAVGFRVLMTRRRTPEEIKATLSTKSG